MAFFGKKAPLLDDLDQDYIAPEIAASERRRKILLGLLGVLVLGGLFAGFAARPLGHAIKGWQAERLAGQANALLAKQDLNGAQAKVRDALALSPLNVAARHSAASFLSQAGAAREAVAFWQKLEPEMTFTRDDQRQYATALLATGDLVQAEKFARLSWPSDTAGTPADWGLALTLALQKKDQATALRLARQLIESDATPGPIRLRTASLLTSASDPALRSQALRLIRKISEQRDDLGLEALIALARGWASNRQAGAAASAELPSSDELATALEQHPKASARVRLFAMDLRLLEDPLRKDELIEAAQKNFANTTDDDLQSLTAWLYGKGEYRKTLALLPEETAVRRQSLFLQRLDTMAALGQWQQVRDEIKQSRFSLDPVTAELYTARCDEQLGNPDTALPHWQAALDAAASDLRQLGLVSEYAAKSGRLQIAEAAARATIQADPTARSSYELLVQLSETGRNAEKLHSVLQQMAVQWPADDAVQNDLAYSALLLGRDQAASAAAAEKLFAKTPNSLPHRLTLALARYRAGNFADGLALLENIEGDTRPLTARFHAIKAALLWSLDRREEAASLLDDQETAQLFPEEKHLIDPLLEANR